MAEQRSSDHDLPEEVDSDTRGQGGACPQGHASQPAKPLLHSPSSRTFRFWIQEEIEPFLGPPGLTVSGNVLQKHAEVCLPNRLGAP